MSAFDTFVFMAAVISGAIASLAGFGIGSVLTPLIAVQLGTKLAVAVVSFPHFAATLLRFLMIRQHLDSRVFVTFGVASAAGGLTGALLNARFASAVLGYVLASLLVFAGISGLFGISQRMRFEKTTGIVAGALSGLFGGLVGNQGGIRSAALMGFNLEKQAFVATATAVGLVVDLFRMPVYIGTQSTEIKAHAFLIAVASAGVLIGTIFGKRLLQRIPDRTFRIVVYLLVLALGVSMFVNPAGK
ncbi:MAG TPA: sulfite exporter TauE/SafE family protein [Terriglobales bacterium]|nr:sulfite exporter TauE/SafE family protein [Terriglobales bacterium]